jgi:AcrR family transcriptional regulator
VPSKREITKERLRLAALDLFVAQGYEATSVAQIAERAGVTEMTFFRHFTSKESPLVDDAYDPVIGQEIADQPAHLDPLTRAVRGIHAAWRRVPEIADDEVRTRLRIVAETPSLRASLTRGSAATEATIADALATSGTPRRTALIAAAAVIGALNAALLDWSSADDTPLGSAIDAALAVVEDRHG